MSSITLDATTNPPTIIPPGSARELGDAGIDGRIVRYWYRCRLCQSHLEVTIDEIKHHDCAVAESV